MSTIPSEYVPGVCNIGRSEVNKRLAMAWFALAVTTGMFVYFVVAPVSPATRALVSLPAAVAAAGFLQAARRFCFHYGLAGISNFGPGAGEATSVADAEDRRRDRRTSLRIIAASLAAGVAVGGLAYALPV